MTQQMREALNKRGIVWGERNKKVADEIKQELKNPKMSFNLWAALHGLRNTGYGYLVRIASQP